MAVVAEAEELDTFQQAWKPLVQLAEVVVEEVVMALVEVEAVVEKVLVELPVMGLLLLARLSVVIQD